ncbi:MAG: beta-galactosidase, partial [Allomuricauda sp.]
KTAGKTHRIILTPDRIALMANGKDFAFVTVSVVDNDGVPCPTATDQLHFRVNGSGSFKAVCNGNPTSLELFHLPTMKLFSGKLVVLVQSKTKAGNIKLSAKGKGLKSAEIQLKAKSR